MIAVTSWKLKFCPGASFQYNPTRILKVFGTPTLGKTFQLILSYTLFEKMKKKKITSRPIPWSLKAGPQNDHQCNESIFLESEIENCNVKELVRVAISSGKLILEAKVYIEVTKYFEINLPE